MSAETDNLIQQILQRLDRIEAAQQQQFLAHLNTSLTEADRKDLGLPSAELDDDQPAPVATDEELADCYSDAAKVAILNRRDYGKALTPVDVLKAQIRAIYNLGRQHGAAQPTPAALPVALSDAILEAECALSDIAEGEETNAAPNTFEWAEQRCAEALATIRPVMQQHKIRTSEWPPVSQSTPAAEPAADNVIVHCPETCWVEVRRIADGKVIYNNHRRGTLTIPVGEPPAEPPAPAGGLVERVWHALWDGMATSDEDGARAAIREVAAWLDQRGMHGCSLWLREEAKPL
jgi:hypothetical protein